MTQYPISALDGRYAKQVAKLAPIMSESGLMAFRLKVMSMWLIFLREKQIIPVDCSDVHSLENAGFESDDAYKRIKELEDTTNHDVKAVEYYMREKLPGALWPWIHFACTSEDVNNAAYALMLQKANEVLEEAEDSVLQVLKEMATTWASVPMLSRTHGQPATPTTMGKEIAVFAHRLSRILERKCSIEGVAKWNGATGNYAAHAFALPDLDWIELSRTFVSDYVESNWNPLTTQIESHDDLAALLGEMGHVSSVMIDLCTDIWGYISNEYLGLKFKKTETGSSTMPGKVNPIDFENARGQFVMARGVGRTLADALPISTWQRDLTDSTLQRNLGTVYGHYLAGLTSLNRGLQKLEIRSDVLQADLERHPEVLGEAIQTVLRKHGDSGAYEKLKDVLRGNKVTLEEIRGFIRKLSIPDEDKTRLLALTPETYIGVSAQLVELIGE
jgi:adenylosuccinate lyase